MYTEIHSGNKFNWYSSIAIGSGKPIHGVFEKIDWSRGDYYIVSEVDLNGDNIYVKLTQKELLSVPYAFYAERSNSGIPGKSAYEIWLENGNSGSVDDFLNSLIGPKGKDCIAYFEKGGNNTPPGFCQNVEACFVYESSGPAGNDICIRNMVAMNTGSS